MLTQNTPVSPDLFAIAYADGSCIGNPGCAGSAFTLSLPEGTVVEWQRHHPAGTNITAEMEALVDCLTYLHPDQPAVIRTDNEMLAKGYNEWLPNWIAKGWRKAKGKPVLNVEIWKRIVALKDAHPKVRVEWVRGHNGNAGNERADTLAIEAARTWALADGQMTINGEALTGEDKAA